MTAINVVRFRVKPGMEQTFLDVHRNGKAAWPGMLRGFIAKVGERSYVLVAEWPNMAAIADNRSRMISTLDTSATRLRIWGQAWVSPTPFRAKPCSRSNEMAGDARAAPFRSPLAAPGRRMSRQYPPAGAVPRD